VATKTQALLSPKPLALRPPVMAALRQGRQRPILEHLPLHPRRPLRLQRLQPQLLRLLHRQLAETLSP